MIYTPTPFELQPLIQRAREKTPELNNYIDRAVQLIRHAKLTFHSDSGWFVHSQSSQRILYHVNGTCTCLSYQSDAPEIAGRRFCKHRLALLLYKEVLSNHLNRRFIGAADDHRNVAASKARPFTYLMLQPESNILVTHNRNPGHELLPICRITKMDDASLNFAQDRDIYSFAVWLDQARPLLTDDVQRAIMIYHEMRAAGFSCCLATLAAEATVCADTEELEQFYITT